MGGVDSSVMRYATFLLILPFLFTGCVSRPGQAAAPVGKAETMNVDKLVKTETEWKRELTPEQYRVLREKGTERPFTGEYNNHKEPGTYSCAGCGQDLFESDTKFESHCGWPSFWDAMDKTRVAYHEDFSHGMHRVEVTCSRCGGHLGHIFDDGPRPTGKRFCINSASLKFRKAGE